MTDAWLERLATAEGTRVGDICLRFGRCGACRGPHEAGECFDPTDAGAIRKVSRQSVTRKRERHLVSSRCVPDRTPGASPAWTVQKRSFLSR